MLKKKIIEYLKTTFSGSQKGVEDVIVSMLPQIVMMATGIFSSVLIARGLGPKGMGDYALILSVAGLAAALSDLGIGQTAIRFASRAASENDVKNQMAILRWAFRLRMLLVLIVSIGVYVSSTYFTKNLWKDSSLGPLVKLSLFTGFFTAIAAIPTIYFQSLKKFKMNATVMVGQTLISFSGILILAFLKQWSVGWVILVSIIATALSATVFILLVPRTSFFAFNDFKNGFNLLNAPRLKYGSEEVDTTGANGFAFFMLISSVVVAMIMRVDVLLMGHYLDKEQIGLYSVASKFTLPLIVGLGALNTALWPRASALTSILKIKELLLKTFKISIVVAAMGILYSIVGPLILPFVFGSSYTGGILIAQILCIRYCIAILVCPIGVVGYSLGLVKVYWVINIFQFTGVVITCIVLLPRIGALGGGVALVANELIGIGSIGVIMFRKLKIVSG